MYIFKPNKKRIIIILSKVSKVSAWTFKTMKRYYF